MYINVYIRSDNLYQAQLKLNYKSCRPTYAIFTALAETEKLELTLFETLKVFKITLKEILLEMLFRKLRSKAKHSLFDTY